MSDNANQPASPIKLNNRVDDGSGSIVIEECDDFYHGLTKREHFAGLALQGLVDTGAYDEQVKRKCRIAVEYADALLKELDKEAE